MLTKICKGLANFLEREDGPTAVEYAVMLALIIVVCLAAIQILGQNANSAFGTVGASIGAVAGS
jgi:pilus assembly protein Flp/PilA